MYMYMNICTQAYHLVCVDVRTKEAIISDW